MLQRYFAAPSETPMPEKYTNAGPLTVNGPVASPVNHSLNLFVPTEIVLDIVVVDASKFGADALNS